MCHLWTKNIKRPTFLTNKTQNEKGCYFKRKKIIVSYHLFWLLENTFDLQYAEMNLNMYRYVHTALTVIHIDSEIFHGFWQASTVPGWASTAPGWPTKAFWAWIAPRVNIRGLQCFKLNGNQTENDRYWRKKNVYFLQNVWKCTVFFAFAFKVCKKCYYDPKYGYKKMQNFMLISNSLMLTQTNAPKKS